MNIKNTLIAILLVAPLFVLTWPSDAVLRRELTVFSKSQPDVAHSEDRPRMTDEDERLQREIRDLLMKENFDSERFKRLASDKLACDFRFPDDGATPLTVVVRDWHEQVLRVFLDAGANPNYPDGSGITPLGHLMVGPCDENVEKSARLLIERSAEVNRYVPFVRVYRRDNVQIPFELWRDGSTRSVSFLESALFHDQNGACVRLLLDHGAAVDRYAYLLWREKRQDLRALNLSRPLF